MACVVSHQKRFRFSQRGRVGENEVLTRQTNVQGQVLCCVVSETPVFGSLSNMDDLIEIVRQHNVIYDTKCKQYKDQSIRTAVWEEIGEQLKQPPEKCKDEWDKLRNAYINALKRRKNKKSGQAAVHVTPWKYEEQMSFLQPFIKSRPAITNLMSPPESPECFELSNLPLESPEPESPQSYQSEQRPETPKSGSSSHAQRSTRNKTNWQDLYDLMKSSHDLRLQKHHSKQQDMDETDLFFLSMSKAVKSLPKLEQTKIKLNLHTAISQAEIRKLQRQEQMITPINVAHQIISQPQQELQAPVQPSTSTILPPTSTVTILTTPSQIGQPVSLFNFDEENISSYYSNANFTDDN